MAQDVWAQTFKYLADQKVLFEGILLKPAMVTPGADSPKRASPDQVADYTLKLLRRRVPPAVPGAFRQQTFIIKCGHYLPDALGAGLNHCLGLCRCV